MTDKPKCQICGEPMPAGEEMFNFHGYSGDCPKPPLIKTMKQALIKYSIRQYQSGNFYIDINVDGQPYHKINGFETLTECERAYEDLLQMQRQGGAVDLPNKPQ